MANYRVLIIDPDPATTKFLSHQLSKAGFEAFVANSSKEGLVLAYQHRPHIIILDPILPYDNLEEFLSKIHKDRRVSRSKIIAFSSLTNSDKIQKAIDLGFYLYLAKEPQAIQVLIDKARIGAELAMQEPEAKLRSQDIEASPSTTGGKGTEGKTVVFLSAKGGVGTTSLCVNMAHIFGQMLQKDVIVADLVLPIGSIASIVGLEDSTNIVQAIEKAGEIALEEFLQGSLSKPENWNFRILAGTSTPKQTENLQISRIPEIIEALKKISEYVVIDLGKSLSKLTIPTLKSADQIVIVLNLDQATVAQTSSVWDYLQNLGIQENQVYFLINHSISREGLTKPEVETILNKNIPLTIPSLGRNFTLSNNLHQPIAEKFPQDSVTLSLRQAAEEILRIIDRKTKRMEYF